MLTNTYYCLLFCLCGLIVGCNSNQNEKTNQYSKQLTLTDSIKIPIDKSMTYRYISHQVVETDSTELLLVGELNINGFVIIDLLKQTLAGKVEYQVSGPNGISSASSGRNFYYHNRDSIFIFGERQSKMFLSNIKGEILSTYNLNQDEQTNFDFGEIIAQNRIQPKFKDSVLTFCVYPTIPVYRNSNAQNEAIYLYYNISKKTLDRGGITYKYLNEKNKHPMYVFPTGVFNNSANVFCLPFKNSIIIEDKEGGVLTKMFKSDYVNEYTPMLEGFEKLKEYDVTSTVNKSLYYDAKNSQYYLLIELGIPYVNPDTGMYNQFDEKPFSVIVFDENFNKICEKKFAGSTYLNQNTFVYNGKLYLSKNNPLNPDFNENNYAYDIYTLEKP